MHSISVSVEIGKMFQGLMYKLLLNLRVVWNVYMSFILEKNNIYLVLIYSVDFKALWDIWNPLNKAIPGKFHGSGGHSKCNSLQDRANLHRSWVKQIVLILNSVNHVKPQRVMI